MRSRRRRQHHGHSSSERWLLTYADLITLLLAFFIVLYAMNQTDYKKMYDLSQSLSSAFHVTSGAGSGMQNGTPGVLPPGGTGILPEQRALYQLRDKLESDLIKAAGPELAKNVESLVTRRGLEISLSGDAFFEPGSAIINPRMKRALDATLRGLKRYPQSLQIEGHTDASPIHTAQFPSNWELSAARAVAVLRYAIDAHHFPPRRLSAAGYGEYMPRSSGQSPADLARNRRVDLVLLRDDRAPYQPKGANMLPNGVIRLPGDPHPAPNGPAGLPEGRGRAPGAPPAPRRPPG